MITTILLFLKSAFSNALKLFLEHWRIIIPLLILAYALYSYNALRIERNAAVTALSDFKTQIAIKVREQEIENAIKLESARKEIEQSAVNHKSQLEAIKNDYAKRNKTNINTIANLRDELREKVRSDTFAIPQVEPNTERTAEEWRNSYATIVNQYQNLIDACKITTSDYNLLRDWADEACNQIGCLP